MARLERLARGGTAVPAEARGATAAPPRPRAEPARPLSA